MKDFQHEQLFTEDPLFEEISNDNSASIIGGARGTFGGRVGRYGSDTFPTVYTTTSQFNDISIKVNGNPYGLYVKAVRADGKGDVSSSPREIPANFHGLITVAANVKDGTSFKLNFDAPTVNYFDISGPITY